MGGGTQGAAGAAGGSAAQGGTGQRRAAQRRAAKGGKGQRGGGMLGEEGGVGLRLWVLVTSLHFIPGLRLKMYKCI